MAKHKVQAQIDEYEYAKDGGWWAVTDNTRLQCCDCGLVHKVNFRIRDGCVEVQLRRDITETRKARKLRGQK